MRFLRRALPGALLATAVLAACGDSTAPKAPENLPYASGEVASITSKVDSIYDQPILDLLRSGGGPVASIRGSLQLAATAPAGEPAVRGDLQAARARIASEIVPGEPVVPTLLRGVTFIWNGTQWTVDTLANGTPKPGAPINGVRFALYRTSSTGTPTGDILGYLTIVDNSTSTVARWTTTVATLAGVTVLSSTSSVSTTGAGGMVISQTGYVSDGTRRIEQTITLNTTSLRATWSAPFAGLSMEFSLGTNLQGAVLSYTFRTPSGTLRIAATQSTSGGSAQIFVNGALWATQSWNANQEFSDAGWQKADGSGTITQQDALVVLDVINFFEALNSLTDFQSAIEDLLTGVAA